MTDQEINEEIAKACDWKRPDDPEVMKLKQGWTMPEKWWLSARGVLSLACDIPDYANDLNAMHEAEKSLQGEHDLTWYLQKLSQVRFRQGESGTIACMLDRLAFATARQRAEAFLRVKGLWREK